MEQINTICAISTPPGRGGIAVVRISGPEAIAISNRIWRGRSLEAVDSHTAHLGKVLDSCNNVLDQAVATVYRNPRSFTGEDVVEFSIHGSTYIQKALLDALIAKGCHVAQPGEFTRRAFINGRLDLAEAEAVADVIASSSKAAHSLAISQLQGQFSANIARLRDRLIELASLLELELDFSEEDVAFADRSKLRSLAEQIISHVTKLSDTFESGNAIRQGVPVAIVGRPNAGKSSLLNRLLGVDRAIVSDIPGTTRDTIEDSTDIQGITFRFIDTAGLRSTADPIEALGIKRAYSSLSSARIILFLCDPESSEKENQDNLSDIYNHTAPGASVFIIRSKCDLLKDSCTVLPDNELLVSAKTGEGIEKLCEKLYAAASCGLPSDESLIVTNARHQAALLIAKKSLSELLTGMDNGLPTDLLAEHLRDAIEALGSITGQITSSTILETIFSRFCIGK